MGDISGAPAADLLGARVLEQITRLGGCVPGGFRPRPWSVRTPAGEHPVPPAVQALLAVEWPPGQGLCTADEFRWEVHLPSDGEVDALVVEDTPRAWYAVGRDEGQWFLLVDLAEADDGDFFVYRVDHDGSDDASDRRRLSAVLRGLRVTTDRLVFPETQAVTSSVIDPDLLVNADPLTVLPLLDQAADDPGAVYRTSLSRHRETDAATRRQLLALDAARWGAPGLSRDLTDVRVPDAPGQEWTIAWATGAKLTRALRMRLEVGGPQVVTEVQGRTVAVTVDGFALSVHDLATGHEVVTTGLAGEQEFEALAVTELDGRWIAVTGGSCPGCDDHDACQGEIRRWNLADGGPLGDPVPAHARSVDALAVTDVDGRRVVLSGGHDCALRMWDLRTGEPIGAPAVGHRRVSDYGLGIGAVAVGALDGAPVAVTGGGDGTVRVWSLADGCTPEGLLTSEAGESCVTSVALGDLDGLPIAVTCGDDAVRVWDLRNGRQLGPVLTDVYGYCDLAEAEGRPVVVTAGYDGRVRMWDLRTRERLGPETDVFAADRRVLEGLSTVRMGGRLLAVVPDYQTTTVLDLLAADADDTRVGHTDAVRALAVTGSAVVTGGDDDTATIWDLERGTPVCPPLTGHWVRVSSVATARVADRSVVLTSDGYALRGWDPTTGERLFQIEAAKAEDGHQTMTLAVAYPEGRATAVTGGHDGRVLTWDLERAERAGHPPLMLQEQYAHALVTAEVEGRQIAVLRDGRVVRLCDLVTGEELHVLGHDHVEAVAVTASCGRVVVATAAYQDLRLWDAATGTEVAALATGWAVHALALADVGGRVIAAGAGTDRTVRTWDLTDGRPYRAPLTFPEDVNALAVTSEGCVAVAFGADVALVSPRWSSVLCR
ncbi:MAG TPA: hypothetical protein VHJ17_09685 [Thermomonospora sp.]|nr:hypothetical protein [Thermomonospora sp.]